MAKKTRIRTDSLARLMAFVLGHRPDEFGLVPDSQGFVTYKELLWALHEEPGWGYVRQGHLNEVLLGKDRALFEHENNRIRALERRWHLDLENSSHLLPKILFVAVRRRAHPVVMEKGLTSQPGKYIVLSADSHMALRIGRRRDPEPVLLEVMASAALKGEVSIYPFGDLFLARQVPSGFINGPPVAKGDERAAADNSEKKQGRWPEPEAGALILDINRDPDPLRRAKGKKRRGWKEEARKKRRRKRH